VSMAGRVFAGVLGRRLPRTHGVDTVGGIERPVRIRRDGWHVPHVTAETDADAFYGLGFCQGQDRTFQIELARRAAAGTLAELVGEQGVAVDRLTRRLGLRRRAAAQLDELRPDLRRRVVAFAAGVSDGATVGLPAVPHEYALLRTAPGVHEPVDVLATMKLHAFLLAGNWQEELLRLRVLAGDGPDALRRVDPRVPAHLPATVPVGQAVGRMIDRIGEDVARLTEVVAAGAASNAWAVSGGRTASGRPLVANDPHLPPALPSHWYLVHLTTPDWSLAGAAFAGTPGIAAGHNGQVAWGVSAGLTDDTDLFLEALDPDTRTVQGPAGPEPVTVRREVIRVRRGRDLVEEVQETPRGPLVGTALAGEALAAARRAGGAPAGDGATLGLSLRAVWLDGGPVAGLLDVVDAGSFEELRRRFADWPALSLNLVAADVGGAIGWQLVGELPVRRSGSGAAPTAAWSPEAGWTGARVPFAAMPTATDPDPGFVVAANNAPVAHGDHPFLGSDFLDGWRAGAIVQALAARADWDPDTTRALQQDTRSLPWEEVRDVLLAVPPDGEDGRLARDLLRRWDGQVAADSPAAAVYELALATLACRVVEAAAPVSAAMVLGTSTIPQLQPHAIVGLRRIAHLVALLREQPDGWFDDGWEPVVAEALAGAVRRLRELRGPGIDGWGWGHVRPLVFRHRVGASGRLLAAVFDRGPFPHGGDTTTIPQASVPPLDPTGNPVAVASLRMVVEAGDWSRARWVLAGGQSGNPVSPHYDDQLDVWRRGGGIPIPWTEAEVAAATRDELRLYPRWQVRRPAAGPVP
jgi:penicillin amidase